MRLIRCLLILTLGVISGCDFTSKEYSEYVDAGVKKARNQDFAGAIEFYTKAIAIESKSELAYYNRGTAKCKLKNFEGGIADFTSAIAKDNDCGLAYYSRGLAKIELGQFKSACLDFKKCKDLGLPFANEALNIYCQ